MVEEHGRLFGGNNDWVGSLGNGFPQELDHLKAEWSASASDATDRFVLAGMFQLPVGRGSLIGSKMNRALDAVVGGWQLTTLLTFQSGQRSTFIWAMGGSRTETSGPTCCAARTS